jgi:ParB family chromosome partitioning protein
MTAKKRGLGRGLDALLQAPKTGTRTVPVDNLKPNRLQPRSLFDEEGLTELAESIKTQGIIQPILVTPKDANTFTIVAGERRWRAAQRAGLRVVPVIIRETTDQRELLEVALVENLQRADLNPLEEAEAFQALQQISGLSQEAIAGRVGKARASITNTIRLLKLPDEVQELLRDGSLKAGQARPLLALKTDEQRLALARQAVAKGMSAREIERRVKQVGSEKKARKRVVDPDTAAAAENLTRSLQTKVEIRRKRRGGSVQIHFHNEDELMRLFDLLMKGVRG